MNGEPIVCDSEAARILGPEGPLARSLPGYEVRPGQLEMATAVAQVIRDDGILLCEAGTGTGKTLAYLVPALLSGRKVVISTATRALQEQIAKKDVPLLAQMLGITPSVAVMKGLANYVCRRRWADFLRSPDAADPQRGAKVRVIESWLRRTTSGDVAELTELDENEPLLWEATSSSETRLGPACPFYDECFVTGMRRAAEQARVVVVNHHLFFADLALRGPHPGRVIPDYDVIIFDEAHQLEEAATTFFGCRVSASRVLSLVADARRTLGGTQGDRPRRPSTAPEAVELAATRFWEELRRQAGTAEPRVAVERDAWGGTLQVAWFELDGALEGLGALAATETMWLEARHGTPTGADSARVDGLDGIRRRADILRTQLADIADGATGYVTWLETDRGRTALSSAPIDLADTFRQRIFESVSAAVLTSATLTSTRTSAPASPQQTRGDFSFLRSRVGLIDEQLAVTELVVASPFDYERNALIYTADDLPLPSDDHFLAAAAQRTEQLIDLAGGGAFVLTTSLRAMRELAARLRAAQRGRTILLQGEAPKQALIDAFRAAHDAVLVATMSFWEGVDVPGSALRLVVIEKIPFLVPTDPIVRARSVQLETEGRNPFRDLSIPAAAISLKQGFGRLIRSTTDVGVVALLDGRVRRRGYGAQLLRALPPATRTNDLETVRDFWASKTRPATVSSLPG